MYWLVTYGEKYIGSGDRSLENVDNFILFNTQTRQLELASTYEFKRLATGITKKTGLVKNAAIVDGIKFVTSTYVNPVTSNERYTTIIEYSDKYFVTLNETGTMGTISYEDAWYQLAHTRLYNSGWTLNIKYGVLEYFLRGGLCRLPESIEHIPVDKKYMRKINEARKINERNSLLGILDNMHVGSNGYVTLMGRPKSIVYDKCTGIVIGNKIDCTDLEVVMLKGKCDYIPSYFLLGGYKLRSIQLPAGIRSMGDAVLNDTGLEVIDLRPYKKMLKIGNMCFSYNKNLRELYYPEAVGNVSNFLLWGNHNLQTVWLPRGCVRLDTVMSNGSNGNSTNVYNSRNSISSMVLPDSKCTWDINGNTKYLRNPHLREIYTPKINIDLAKRIQSICNKKAHIIVGKRA